MLFDVDGTLFLTDDPLVGRALRETLGERFRVELPEDALERVDHEGQTALRIGRLVLRDAGLDEPELGPWCAEFAEPLPRAPRAKPTRAAGARPPAPRKRSRGCEAAGHRLALLTGNPEPVARARLERLGLARFFPAGQGAFGCESEARAELIDARPGPRGRLAAPTATVEVGDTARRRRAAPARPASARCASATGTGLADALAQLG